MNTFAQFFSNTLKQQRNTQSSNHIQNYIVGGGEEPLCNSLLHSHNALLIPNFLTPKKQKIKCYKILLIVDDISLVGGAERVVVNLANAFSELYGIDVAILSLNYINKNLPYVLGSNIKVSFYKYPIEKHQIKQIKNFCKRCIIKFKVILWKLKFLCLEFRLLKTDKILKYRLSTYIISYNSSIVLDNTWFDHYPYIKSKNTKYIMLMHISYYCKSQYVNQEYFKNLKNYDKLVVLSIKELDIWQRYHNNIAVIPNFLPQIPQENTDYTQKVILSVGRMDKGDQKGFLRLIDIWKMVQDKIVDCHESLHDSRNDRMANDLFKWKLIIVGDGILKEQIESKIKSLNLQDSIVLKPFTKNIEQEYLSASIYAMASYFEGFPMVLLESTSYGLAPISFDIATGPSDIIEHNKSGFLIDDNDLQDYADKLITLMSDESIRIRFGKEAKRIVSNKFSKEVILNLWEKLLMEK